MTNNCLHVSLEGMTLNVPLLTSEKFGSTMIGNNLIDEFKITKHDVIFSFIIKYSPLEKSMVSTFKFLSIAT